MSEAFICAAKRSAIGRYAGSLAGIRPDDLLAQVIAGTLKTLPSFDPAAIDDVLMGCANQAGEDNRNVARMSALLAGLPSSVPAATVNRLCGSGLDAVGTQARAIKAGELEIALAGGVESMSRAPFVMGKAESAFARSHKLEDTTMGWRFINPLLKQMHGVDTMPQTADNVAAEYQISREDQDLFAFNSQQKAHAAQSKGLFDDEILEIQIPQRKGDPLRVDRDEHLRPDTQLEKLASLKPVNGEGGSVTAGNASGINDGACALLLASESACNSHQLEPKARVLGMATAGVDPRIMGVGPIDAVKRVLRLTGLSLEQMDLIELNEAFASQALGVMKGLNLDPADPRINPQGGAIALGHPLGMSGARLVTTATYQLHRSGGRYALCTMCIGVGQGIAAIIERV
ncbi:3-oxoadipyl-CoA thiolase [Marinobacterium mangrovicola]|uniref:3-oxoadipyl-CoA thiolase n=1 Tax=Marinobacterium mangrovicola TaxID=1476959 RepID=A0A4R1GLJ0_9GAMM|nr:3-oxoadipyl-CoA thiolase [Marinobacterium mangrovicola]TCK06979.1 3-oxoadipyl-CoA thiolase [Marinobacterium mangrovicola]